MRLIILLLNLAILGCSNPRSIQVLEVDNGIELYCNEGIPSDIRVEGEVNGKKVTIDRKRTPLLSPSFSVFDGIVNR